MTQIGFLDLSYAHRQIKHIDTTNCVCNICKTLVSFKSFFIQIRDLRMVRQYLTPEPATLVTNVLVSGRLYYSNSLFRSLSNFSMRKLQYFQNTLARIVTSCNGSTWAPLIQPRLHWLMDKLFWIFKMAALVYKFLHSDYPSLFGSLLSIHCGTYCTRYDHPGKRFFEIPQYYPAVPR